LAVFHAAVITVRPDMAVVDSMRRQDHHHNGGADRHSRQQKHPQDGGKDGVGPAKPLI
jgi:hypothetical protein